MLVPVMEMDLNHCALTILWRIKNFRFWENEEAFTISSAGVRPFSRNGPTFWLGLDPKTPEDDSLRLYLHLVGGIDVDIPLAFEWSFLSESGPVLVSRRQLSNNGLKSYESLYAIGCPTHKEVFQTERSKFLPHDTLTIQCKLWTSSEVASNEVDVIFTSTFLERKCSVPWIIPRFADLPLNCVQSRTVNIDESNVFRLELSLECETLEDSILKVVLYAVEIDRSVNLFCRISVLYKDKYPMKTMGAQLVIDFPELQNIPCDFPLVISRREILSKGTGTVRDGCIHLRCDFEYVGLTEV